MAHAPTKVPIRRRVAAVAVVVAGLMATPGAAARVGACEGDAGVTVVVDGTALGGDLEVSCASGAPSNGFEALTAAGFAVEGVAATPGLLCRIDGLPSTADEPCVDDPPIDFYWSYWVGDGRAWRYSAEGAATREPPPGAVEGWAFVVGSPARPPGIDLADLGAATDGSPPASPDSEPSSPWGSLVGIALVAGLATAAAVAVVRRRAGEDAP